jgi:2-iminoacetate synthase ThiH
MDRDIKKTIQKVEKGKRLDASEGLALFRHADLLTFGELANNVRKRLHPERRPHPDCNMLH